tara:strand:+ start:565 stop:1461 length:897 start_codon:yes stop_codon:yes gene_type:complete
MKRIIGLTMALVGFAGLAADNIGDYLTSISVTVRAEGGYNRAEGSGTLFKRMVDGREVVFCHTAAHVIAHTRSVRDEIVDGKPVKVVEFGSPFLVRKLRNPDTGRIVGETVVAAKVVRYSDAETGHDLALLRVLAKDFKAPNSVKFLSRDAKLVPLGTHLWGCGSLLGSDGANSITDGVLSQHGRILFRSTDFTQVSTVAFPGSSGGGNFNDAGQYVGMLVRGTRTQGFNFLVPIKRMWGYYEKSGMAWCMDPSVKVTEKDISKTPIEDTVGTPGSGRGDEKKYPFLIRRIPLGGAGK